MRSRFVWLLLVAPACEWIDDEADRVRRDADDDGLPMAVDCNDRDSAILEMPEPERDLPCGERVAGEVRGADRLQASTCLHPVGNGEELAQYAKREDLWQLTVPSDGEVEVRLIAPGFRQGSSADEELDLARVVLWAWPEGDCPRENCHLGLPLANSEGVLEDGEVTVRFDAVAESDWVIVVTGRAGEAYELVADCP